jgi:hypothetical protein
VPTLLPYGVKIGYKFYSHDTVNNNTYNASGFMNAGENHLMQLPAQFNLLYPSDDTIGVTYNTEFNHNDSGMIYEFRIGNYTIITALSYAKIPIGDLYGIPFPSNSLLSWYVIKHNTSNIDDLVREYDLNYPSYHIIRSKTNQRVFRTALSNRGVKRKLEESG